MNRKILLVEDDIIIALSEASILEENGYEIRIAPTGEEALAAAGSDQDIDLILMDINLGDGMDGIEAAELILADRDIPLVFMSSHTEKDIFERTEGITSYGYIVKNSDETLMLASIKMAFRLYEARKAEAEKWMAESIWDKTINSINDSILLINNDNVILKHNRVFAEKFGNGESDLRGQKCMEVVHNSDICPEVCPFDRMKHSRKREEGDVEMSDGIYRVIQDPIFNRRGELEGAVLIIADVTEHRKAEYEFRRRLKYLTAPPADDEEYRIENIFDPDKLQMLQDDFSAAHGIASIICTPDGTPVTRPSGFSRFCYEIVRGTAKGRALCRRSDAELGRPQEDGPRVMKCLSCGIWDAGTAIVVGGRHTANWLIGQVRDESISEEDIIIKLDEIGADRRAGVEAFRELPVMSRAKFTRIANLLYHTAENLSDVAYKNIQQARLISRITENEERIQGLLEEKELLLKEVHHRIKNNISSLAGLLSMQLEFTSQPEAVSAIQDAVARVNSTRVLYERLQNTEGFEEISAPVFLKGIVDAVVQMFPERENIRVEVSVDDFILGSDLLFPIGIIVNELLTNIYKYAFNGASDALIELRIKKLPGMIDMVLNDNGRGFPDDVPVNSNGNFGLKLIKMLAMQIGADFDISNRVDGLSGTCAVLRLMRDI